MVFKKGDKTNIGREPWNKGLNSYSDNRIKKGYKFEKEVIKRRVEKWKKSYCKEKHFLFGKHRSNDWKIKMIENAKINPNFGMKGKFHLEKSKKKIGNFMRGKHHTQEVKDKIGLGNKGKVISEEARKKMKIARINIVSPKKDTSIEVKIQEFLKQLGIQFFTHQYMKIEHGYQCDILIPSMNLVVECDGNYWHKYPTGTDIDHIRTKELIEKGFKVLRLWEIEIKSIDINKFKEVLKN